MAEHPKFDPRMWNHFKYCHYQLEVGEEGTPHYQGYVQFARTVTAVFVQTCIPRAHWSRAKGSYKQNLEYCGMGNNGPRGDKGCTAGPWRYGDPPCQGKRTDLDEIGELIEAGVPLKEIAPMHRGTFMRNMTNIIKYKCWWTPARDHKTTVIVLYGDPGVGKSSWGRAHFPDAYKKMAGNYWWERYDSEETIIMDDFESSWFPPGALKDLFDRGGCEVQCKGGSHQIVAKTMVVSSNLPPDAWYDYSKFRDKDLWGAIERRIDYIIKYTAPTGDAPGKIETLKEKVNAPFYNTYCPRGCEQCKKYWDKAGVAAPDLIRVGDSEEHQNTQ
jgi:hypothetical protein